MMDVTCSELNVGRLGSSATEQDQTSSLQMVCWH